MSDEMIKFASGLADVAGEIIRPFFRKNIGVIDKEDESPVTQADQQAEASMREQIAKAYPTHGIFGEEHGVVEGDGQHMWVLDPIDGTRSFICGAPWFGTLIAYLENNVPEVGVINVPMMGERWVGDGQQTFFNGEPAAVRKTKALSEASLFTTDLDLFTADQNVAFSRVKSQAKCVRYGTDCYAYGLLASGHIDLVIEAGLKPYDAMALIPVIKGAGGIVTGWDGDTVDLNWDGRLIAAATPELHAQILDELNK